MKTYIKFIIFKYLRSFFFIFLIMFCLVFILNLLSELDFFKNLDVRSLFPIYLTFLNSVSIIFEMFPFVFLISTQFFFISFFKNSELNTFKYSGLKNLSIIKIISFLSLIMGIIIIIFYYNIASNFKNFYLELKSQYTSDDKYLAVITNNGLWIKDKVKDKTRFVNSKKIDANFLIENSITEFDEDFELIRHIKSEKIDIKDKEWIVHNATIFNKNNNNSQKKLQLKSNFDYQKIQSLFSNLSSLSILELFKLKDNYKLLGYSMVEVDMQIHKLISYPLYFILMTILSSILMLNFKNLNSTGFKISIGLFFAVLIYYINNFFYVLGSTERMSILFSIWIPLIFLTSINFIMLKKINEK
tara:strand:- start:5128 stop:6201 length:1074 start_codon:yes stop_codon:yes gene_type:complete